MEMSKMANADFLPAVLDKSCCHDDYPYVQITTMGRAPAEDHKRSMNTSQLKNYHNCTWGRWHKTWHLVQVRKAGLKIENICNICVLFVILFDILHLLLCGLLLYTAGVNSNVSFCTHYIYCTCPSWRGILLCCSPEGFFPFFPWRVVREFFLIRCEVLGQGCLCVNNLNLIELKCHAAAPPLFL